jgi:hypothetical protein
MSGALSVPLKPVTSSSSSMHGWPPPSGRYHPQLARGPSALAPLAPLPG